MCDSFYNATITFESSKLVIIILCQSSENPFKFLKIINNSKEIFSFIWVINDNRYSRKKKLKEKNEIFI